VKARDLRAGSVFRKPGQRKWRIAARVGPLTPNPVINGDLELVVFLHDCRALIFDADEEVEVPKAPIELDRDGFVKLGRRRAVKR